MTAGTQCAQGSGCSGMCFLLSCQLVTPPTQLCLHTGELPRWLRLSRSSAAGVRAAACAPDRFRAALPCAAWMLVQRAAGLAAQTGALPFETGSPCCVPPAAHWLLGHSPLPSSVARASCSWAPVPSGSAPLASRAVLVDNRAACAAAHRSRRDCSDKWSLPRLRGMLRGSSGLKWRCVWLRGEVEGPCASLCLQNTWHQLHSR
jgi:hypothetical protein